MLLFYSKCIKNNSYSRGPVLRTCCENRDVDESCSGVRGRLFEGLSVQPLGLLHVDGLHLLGEAHLGVGLCQADQGLQLSGVGGHHPPAAADLPHVHVGLRTDTHRVSSGLMSN